MCEYILEKKIFASIAYSVYDSVIMSSVVTLVNRFLIENILQCRHSCEMARFSMVHFYLIAFLSSKSLCLFLR